MIVRLHLVALLVVTAASAPRAARAQPAEDPDALIEEGLQLRRDRRDADALERFQRAYRLRETPRALAQIALAEQATGRMVDAHEHLVAALGSADDPWIAEHHAALSDALATIRGSLGQLVLTDGVEGAEVRIDGQTRATLPLSEPMWVSAGELVVEVLAPGYHPFVRRVRVDPGGRARANIQLVSLPSTPTEVATESTTDAPGAAGGSTPSVVGITLTAVGGALVVGGVISGALALADASALHGQCTPEGLCPDDPALRAAADRVGPAAIAGDVLLFSGLAVAATGVILMLVLPQEQPSAQAAMACTPSGCMATIAGAF